ncbi:MAG: thermonuclease family protein [Desulfotignum sp.]
MFRLIKYVIFFLVLCCLVMPVTGDVFTWTDSDGIRHFSNVSPPDTAENTRVLEERIGNRVPSDRQFKVVKVYDGDSLLVQGMDLTLKIRMVGIDAPETGGSRNPGQPFSRKAHQYLSRQIQDRSVTLKTYGLGGYNRILAEVFINDINMNLEMVKAGLAEVYQGNLPETFNAAPYLAAQDQAAKRRIGMWVQGSRYKSPRQWRKENPRN